MSDIVQFTPRSYVEIDSGTVIKSDDASQVGRFIYFVSVVQMGEAPMGVWDGESHLDAIREASFVAAGLSLPVVDLTKGRQH